MRPDNFKIQIVIESLTGTCAIIEDHLPEGMELEDLTEEDHEAIDDAIFECEECNWWFEQSDMSTVEDQYCESCRPNEDE